jgi:hypothetical protein
MKDLPDIEPGILDPTFHEELYQWFERKGLAEKRIIDPSGLQEECSIRDVLRARTYAARIIDDNAQFDEEELENLIREQRASLYGLGPDGVHRRRRDAHRLQKLEGLREKSIRQLLMRISKPYANPQADQLIRETSGLSAGAAVKDRDARRAALSALLTYLRQNVGSCFATAPAILIHTEQPAQFLVDLDHLLSIGQLKRTYGGVEYAVPMSPSWGAGDLMKRAQTSLLGSVGLKAAGITNKEIQAANAYTPLEAIEHTLTSQPRIDAACVEFRSLSDNALLKSWEFTLASLSESKNDFTRWNLYASLGMNVEQVGGIGWKLYQVLKEKLDGVNAEVQKHQENYEPVYNHVKYLEARGRRASTEQELKYIQVERRSRVNEMHSLLELRDRAQRKGQILANLHTQLLDEYDHRFRDYFQEIYDADMHEVQLGPYDDSPAGFRLLCKHGRSNPALWVLIQDAQQFQNALAAFFIYIENDLATAPDLEEIEEEIHRITSELVMHVRTDEFMLSAYQRMAEAHNVPLAADPLAHPDKVQKKPWSYTSGGTMKHLVSCYYRREQPPTEESRWVEEPTELLVFLLDILRGQSPPYPSMLMHSPTHAFNLKPTWSPFRVGWEREEYSYTWARDNWIAPQQEAINQLRLNANESEYIVQTLASQLPERYQQRFLERFRQAIGAQRPSELRNQLVDGLARDDELQKQGRPIIAAEEIDGALFSMLPITPVDKLRDVLHDIFLKLGDNSILSLVDTLDKRSGRLLVSSLELERICLSLMALQKGAFSVSEDIHSEVLTVMRELNLAMPEPIRWADSNWVTDDFAFLVSVATGKLELWRTDALGRTGFPLHSWRQWLDGSVKEPKWGVFTAPREYEL